MGDLSMSRAEALARGGDLDGAAALLRPLVTRGGGGDGAAYLFSSVLIMQRRYAEAEPLLEELLRRSPQNTDILNSLGVIALEHHQNWSRAERLFQEVVARQPADLLALGNLGNAYFKQSRLAEAERTYRQVLSIDPDNVNALNNLGALAKRGADFDAALDCYRRAYALAPRDPNILRNLLITYYYSVGDDREAVRLMEEILALPAPGVALLAVYPLAKLNCMWEVEERIREPVIGMALQGLADPLGMEMLLLNVMANPEVPPARLAEMHRVLGGQLRRQLQRPPYTTYRSPGPKLRVGYLSGDFRAHSVHKFLREVIGRYDRSRFEVYCYSTVNPAAYDSVTREYQQAVDAFVDVSAMAVQELAARIHGDGIQVLVSLTGYTGGARMGVACYRPAPVQISYLGYPFTTGLDEMDFMISDPWLDTPANGPLFTERALLLPRPFIAYEYEDYPGKTAAGPRARNGYVTFGSLNNPYKLNRQTVATWAAVLARVPGSRLVLNNPKLKTPENRESISAEFGRHGIDAGRIDYVWERHPGGSHLAWYNDIDIALDTFPLTGGTTTVDAVLMGVPVVTLVGEVYYERLSFAILSASGIAVDALVAATREEYVEKAVALAADPGRLTALRKSLIEAVPRSPLCDTAGFARAMEAAYLDAWERSGAATANTPDGSSARAEELLRQGDPVAAEALLAPLRTEGGDPRLELLYALALMEQRKLAAAEPVLEALAQRFPDDPDLINNVGIIALDHRHDWTRAGALFARVLELRPEDPVALTNLGNVQFHLGRFPEAEAIYVRAAALAQGPVRVNILANLGALATRRAEFARALGYYREAHALAPRDPRVLGALLTAHLQPGGDEQEASRLVPAILALPQPGPALPALYPYARQRCLWEVQDRIRAPLTEMLLRGAADPAELERVVLNALADAQIPLPTLFAMHRSLARRLREQMQGAPFTGYRRREGKLRIGYLSGDLRAHAVHRFLGGLIARHDRTRFEVHCYSTLPPPLHDEVTREYQRTVDAFVDVSDLPTRAVAERIHADGIDVLVHLSGYTRESRMELTCYRAAPVQIAYLGYPFSSGMEEMDFIITDPCLDTDAGRPFFTERPLRLPRPFVAHAYPEVPGRTAEGPRARNGHITFGSLNAPYKLDRPVVAAWAAILQRVAGSRLVLNHPQLAAAEARAAITAEFARHGVAPERVGYVWQPHPSGNPLAHYHGIDLALDTFPVTGGTTTVDALLMGVPVVTLAGEIYHQRISCAVLSGCGAEVSELMADGVEEYVAKAVRLAGDPARLTALRRRLLESVPRSELCDVAGFARAMEEAYLAAWRIKTEAVRVETLEGLLGELADEGWQVCVAGATEALRAALAGRGGIAFAPDAAGGDGDLIVGLGEGSCPGRRRWRYLPALHRLVPAGEEEAVGPVLLWPSPEAERRLGARGLLWEPPERVDLPLAADTAPWAAFLAEGPFGPGLVQAWTRTMGQHPEWELFSAALNAYATVREAHASAEDRLARLEQCNELLFHLAQGAPTASRLAVLLQVSLELGLWAQAATLAGYLEEWFAAHSFVPDEPLVPFPGVPSPAAPAELGPALARWAAAAREALERLGVVAEPQSSQ